MINNIQYGTSTLSTLINQGSMYIDKTARIYDLITQHTKRFFLFRPRRFGKSLLIDTLSEIFQGNKELFKGLAIYDTDYDWKKYVVIRIDMTDTDRSTVQELKDSLTDSVRQIADDLGIDISSLTQVVTPRSYMSTLLKKIKKMGQKAVVLIDEYDYPILSNIGESPSKNLTETLQVLKDFYLSFKTNDSCIHFLFLTGVTRIAYTSIFSGINNLNDISFDPDFWDILGYTQEELETNFSPFIDAEVKEKGLKRSSFIDSIKDWYDGYRFSSKDSSVYNPADINLFFTKDCDFYPYWIKTGTPTFMVRLLSKFSNFDLKEEFLLPRSVEFLNSVIDITQDLDKEQLILLLYQSGYLTIKSGNKDLDEYYLGFPNREVSISFNSYIAESVLGKGYNFFTSYKQVARSLLNGDIEGFKKEVKKVFASMQKTPQKYHENAVELVLSLLLRMVGGYKVLEQLRSGDGVSDIVVIAKQTIYIIELKMDSDPQVALDQIKDRGYADIYINNAEYDSYSILAIGLCFNSSNCSYKDCDTTWIRKI